MNLAAGILRTKIVYREGQVDRDLERKMEDFYYKHPFHNRSFSRLRLPLFTPPLH